jgi:homocitrate synthase NifV
MPDVAGTVVLRDSTLREGLDTPGVGFSEPQAIAIARKLAECGVAEAEIVAPSRVADGLGLARRVRAESIVIRTSGLIYAAGARCKTEIDQARDDVDRFDLLMPLSPRREPSEPREKLRRLLDALAHAEASSRAVGAGFPHATQAAPAFLLEMARESIAAGAARITLYDTNGSSDPFAVRELVEGLTSLLRVPVFFHAHNDLGLATANALAAVLGGASGLDVTVNGLGDRAGNASLEQVVLTLHLRGHSTGVDPAELRSVSRLVEDLSRVPISKLAPVVGEFVFAHRSPGHLAALSEFEAFPPELVGTARRVDRTDPRSTVATAHDTKDVE